MSETSAEVPAGPIAPEHVAKIRQHVDLMRWSDHVDDDPPADGSLADDFWNRDIPALLAAADRDAGVLSESPTKRLSAAIEAYLVDKYGSAPAIPESEKNGDGMLDIWLAIHGTA